MRKNPLDIIENAVAENDIETAKNALRLMKADQSRAHQLLGDLFRRQKLFADAIEAYETSIEVDKLNIASAYGRMESLKGLGRVDEFKAAASDLRDNKKLNENLLSRIVLASAEVGDTVTTKFLIQRLLAEYPNSNDARTWFRLGKAWLLLGNREECLKYAKISKDNAIGNSDLLLEIATLDYKVDEYWELRYISSQGERTPVPVSSQSDSGYAERNLRDTKFLEETFFAFFGDAKFKKGADCGCGSGRLTKFLAKWCEDLDCFDISSTAVKFAQDNNKELSNVAFNTQNMCEVPLPAEKYDLIFDFTAVQHVADTTQWKSVLSNYMNAAKLGGILFFVEVKSDGGRREVLHVSNATPEDYIDHVTNSGAKLLHQQVTPWGEICLIFEKISSSRTAC